MLIQNSAPSVSDSPLQQELDDPIIWIREPTALDGHRVWSLIGETRSLDNNSLYCNLLQCTHFAKTCAVAEQDGEVIAWLSAYIPPEQPTALFVWQICVSETARGRGLGQRMICSVLARKACDAITTLECTITHDNKPSWALFSSIARKLDANIQHAEHFLRNDHLNGQQESEYAVTTGPFCRQQIYTLQNA